MSRENKNKQKQEEERRSGGEEGSRFIKKQLRAGLRARHHGTKATQTRACKPERLEGSNTTDTWKTETSDAILSLCYLFHFQPTTVIAVNPERDGRQDTIPLHVYAPTSSGTSSWVRCFTFVYLNLLWLFRRKRCLCHWNNIDGSSKMMSWGISECPRLSPHGIGCCAC